MADADELEIVDDEDQTLALDGEDEVEIDEGDEENEGGFDDDENEPIDDEEAAPIQPPNYRPDSNLYTVLLVIGFLAYAVALGFVLDEMQAYCDPKDFMWGAFK